MLSLFLNVNAQCINGILFDGAKAERSMIKEHLYENSHLKSDRLCRRRSISWTFNDKVLDVIL